MIRTNDGIYKNNYNYTDISEFKTLIFDSHKKCTGDIQNFLSIIGANYEEFDYIYNMDMIVDFETNNNIPAYYKYSDKSKKGIIYINPNYLKTLIESTRRLEYGKVVDNLDLTLINESLKYNRIICQKNTDVTNMTSLDSIIETRINETIALMIMYHRKSSKLDLEGFYNYIIKNHSDNRVMCIIAYLIRKHGIDLINKYILEDKNNEYENILKTYLKDYYDKLLDNIYKIDYSVYENEEGNDDIYYNTMNILEHKLK